ncbi:MAG: hypothetical protein P8014_20090 [Acidihalobacter sp.]|uniref:hypothetical protein n=1 Tax=Acidihalobacter sp. TaxID=1872108 RepID=UPI00307E7E6C
MAVIDFGSRVGDIYTDYKAGGNWEREMFVQSLSFTMTALTGSIATSVGMYALGFVVALTPIGWVGLVIGGLIVAGVAATGSVGVNNLSEHYAGTLYDKIMHWLSSL